MDGTEGQRIGIVADVDGTPCPPQILRWMATLPQDLLHILDVLNQHGHGAWLVGGCVRDAWLDQSPTDIDLCTTCPPEETMKLFGAQAIATGLEFGTITLKGHGQHYEATTLRTESMYRDGRRPEHVEWGTSLNDDLSRRDFTINSMAIDVARRELYDPFNGQKDLQNQTVRAVGEATQRCQEDALRILRAYRFLSRGEGPLWTLESSLHQAVLENRARLDMVAIERRWSEASKIISSPHAGELLHRMSADGVLSYVFEGQHIEHALMTVLDESRLKQLTLYQRLGVLLLNQTTKSVVQQLKGLRTSREMQRATATFHEALHHVPQSNKGAMRVFRHVMAGDAHAHLLACSVLSEGGLYSTNADGFSKATQEALDAWSHLEPQQSPPTSLVDGHWIMARTGIGQGMRLGRLKDWLHRIQIEEDLSEPSQLEQRLSRLAYEHGDHASWPRLEFP